MDERHEPEVVPALSGGRGRMLVLIPGGAKPMNLTTWTQLEERRHRDIQRRPAQSGRAAMNGSQMGLAHLVAQSRYRDFVSAAEADRAVVAAIGRAARSGSVLAGVRGRVGAILIAIGQRVGGGELRGDASPVGTAIPLAR